VPGNRSVANKQRRTDLAVGAPTRAKLVRTLVDGGECLADVVG
jgi:hypothetical protein